MGTIITIIMIKATIRLIEPNIPSEKNALLSSFIPGDSLMYRTAIQPFLSTVYAGINPLSSTGPTIRSFSIVPSFVEFVFGSVRRYVTSTGLPSFFTTEAMFKSSDDTCGIPHTKDKVSPSFVSLTLSFTSCNPSESIGNHISLK